MEIPGKNKQDTGGTRVFLERGQKPLDASGSEGIPDRPPEPLLTATMLRPSGRMVARVASVAFFLKIAIALRTYGTNDVFAYERFLHWSRYLGHPDGLTVIWRCSLCVPRNVRN